MVKDHRGRGIERCDRSACTCRPGAPGKGFRAPGPLVAADPGIGGGRRPRGCCGRGRARSDRFSRGRAGGAQPAGIASRADWRHSALASLTRPSTVPGPEAAPGGAGRRPGKVSEPVRKVLTSPAVTTALMPAASPRWRWRHTARPPPSPWATPPVTCRGSCSRRSAGSSRTTAYLAAAPRFCKRQKRQDKNTRKTKREFMAHQ